MKPQFIGSFLSATAGNELAIYRGIYESNHALSIMLMGRVAGTWQSPYAILSVNMDHGQDHESSDLPPNCFYVKEWSENSKVAEEALASGWFQVREDLPISHSGYVKARVWELLSERRHATE